MGTDLRPVVAIVINFESNFQGLKILLKVHSPMVFELVEFSEMNRLIRLIIIIYFTFA